MNTKQTKLWMFLGCTFALSTTLGINLYRHWRPLAVRAASVRAYTVTRIEQGSHAGKPDNVWDLYVEAQRSDGARVNETIAGGTHQRDLHFPNGDEIVTNELTKQKTTYLRRFGTVPGGVPGVMDPAASCQTADAINLGSVVDGIETVGGQRAVRRILNLSIGKLTMWNALDAGCALIQQRLDYDGGVASQTLKSLAVSEPSADLFKVGDDFQEQPPSILYQNRLHAAQSKRLDEAYYALRVAGN